MAKKIKKKSVRSRKYIVLLSNQTDHRDDESFTVWAKTDAEAETKARQKGWNAMRFDLRGIYLASELR